MMTIEPVLQTGGAQASTPSPATIEPVPRPEGTADVSSVAKGKSEHGDTVDSSVCHASLRCPAPRVPVPAQLRDVVGWPISQPALRQEAWVTSAAWLWSRVFMDASCVSGGELSGDASGLGCARETYPALPPGQGLATPWRALQPSDTFSAGPRDHTTFH